MKISFLLSSPPREKLILAVFNLSSQKGEHLKAYFL